MTEDMRITVAICTRNRAAQLPVVLESASRLVTPKGLAWELCLVDNGSTDATPDVARSFEGRLPLRYLREDKAGLSNARNRAVEAARGEYICWTDDDVELEPDWLAAYAAAFDRHPEAAVFGGRILPRLETPTPDWFTAAIDTWPVQSMLAARDLGDDIVPLTQEGNRMPWGANYALRTAEQRLHPYDANLGVSPSQRRLGEEAEVMFRILRDGNTGWWVPDAKVHHIFPTRRQTRESVLAYYTAMGETLAYLDAEAPGAHHLHMPGRRSPVDASLLSLHRRRARAAVEYVFARLKGADADSVDRLRQVGLFSGALAFRKRPH